MERIIRLVCSLLLLLSLVSSCRTHGCDVAHSEVCDMYTERVCRDSVFLCDSVLVRERADTVFLTRTRTLYRERVRTDTLWRSDTVVCVKNVYTEGRNSGRGGLFWLLIAVPLALWLIRLFRK